MAKHPTTLPTVEDLAAIYDTDEAGDERLTNSDSDWVQWAEGETDDIDDTALLVLEEAT